MPTYTGQLRTRRLLWTSMAARSSSKMFALAKDGLARRRRSLSSSCARTSLTFDSFSQVLHGLTEDGVVHQFVEIVLEGAGGLLLGLVRRYQLVEGG